MGVERHDETVLQAVFTAMAKANAEAYGDTAQTRHNFDAVMDVCKAGHMRSVDAMNTHPGTTEYFDKFIFIFNAEGKCVAQPWHVDASTNIATSFTLWTKGLGTLLAPFVDIVDLERALCLVGIPAAFHKEALDFAKRDLPTKESAASMEDILQDIAPALSADFERFLQLSRTNGVLQDVGFTAATRGPWPHAGAGSPDGAFRLCLLITSAPDVRGSRVGYNASMQHHRSQACIYWCCFIDAVRWLWADRKEAHDEDRHWGDCKKTQVVIRDFLTASLGMEQLRDDACALWARALAWAYVTDEKMESWPRWVPDGLRGVLTDADTAQLQAAVQRGAAVAKGAADAGAPPAPRATAAAAGRRREAGSGGGTPAKRLRGTQ